MEGTDPEGTRQAPRSRLSARPYGPAASEAKRAHQTAALAPRAARQDGGQGEGATPDRGTRRVVRPRSARGAASPPDRGTRETELPESARGEASTPRPRHSRRAQRGRMAGKATGREPTTIQRLTSGGLARHPATAAGRRASAQIRAIRAIRGHADTRAIGGADPPSVVKYARCAFARETRCGGVTWSDTCANASRSA